MVEKNQYWDKDGNNASTLDPREYHDPSNEVLTLSHRTMASVLPPAHGGARGVIVPRATESGAPPGFNPDGIAARMNVDPDIPGESFVVDLSAITKDTVAAATSDADVLGATSVEDRRYRASQAFQRFAVSNKPDRPAEIRKAPRESPIPLPGVYVVPEAAEGGGQLPVTEPNTGDQPHSIPIIPVKRPNIPGFTKVAESTRQVAPTRSISTGSTQAERPAGPVTVAPGRAMSMLAQATASNTPLPPQPAVVAPSSGVPTFKVTFEVQGAPAAIEAWFHQVFAEGHILAMCYNLASTGYPRMTLRTTPADIAVHIDGSDVFYIVQDPGIKFPHNGEEVQLFFIKSEHPFTPEMMQEQAAAPPAAPADMPILPG